MGSGKGQSQSASNQNQTYTPNAQAGSYITDALSRAQQTANLPFNIPQAPVAGFSQDQQSAFGNVRNAQGIAQPYFNKAQGYFDQSATPDVASFYNPMAQNVTNQLQNIFGQQNVQNTGNLVQSAGGVGADRIAVGQANMANQQGLAAGQTYAGLYQQAVQAAQQQQQTQQAAGYGTAAMGSASQNAALQGAQAQLGTGSLQQQLQQAQLNSPYQQQLAQAAFPYQQAQFYGNMVGALAPGLGGTTTGQSNTTNTPAQPSMWSQILGAGTAGLGALGGSGAFGGQGWLTGSSPSYGGGNFFSGDAYGGSASNPIPGLSASDYGSARGGAIGYDEGGSVSDRPINIASNPFIPQTQMHAIQPHIPQLQQQQQSGGGGDSGGGIGDILKTGAQIATMFLKRGGSVPGYDDGGFVDPFGDDKRALGRELLRAELGTRAPDSIPGGEPAPEPYRLDPAATDAWRSGVSRDMAAGNTAQTPEAPMMTATAQRPGRMTASAAPPDSAMAFAGKPDASADLPPEITGGNSYAPQRAPAGAGAPSGGGSDNPFSIPISNRAQERQDSFANSPWAALMQAGLGIMGGTSPFAGVNIGQGGMQGLKTLEQQREASQKEETIAQAAKRLELEAKFHEDQFNRMTMGQKLQQEQADRPYNELTAAQQEAKTRQDRLDDLAEKRFNRPYEELTAVEKAHIDEQNKRSALEAAKPFKIGVDRSGFDIMGVRDPKNPGRYLDAVTGEPIEPSRVRGAPTPQAAAQPDGAVAANAAAVAAGAYNYAEAAPSVEKGMDVPEPAAVGNHSARSVQADAEYYLQTGKLPPGPRGGKSPTAIQQNDYVNAVRNYAGTLAQSRGLTPEQTAEMWRTSPGTLRFILGQDGRATVSLGTAVRHLDTLRQLSDAWNAGDVQRLNQLRAAVSREFGGSAATNLQSAAALIGPEIIKALGVAGAGTSQERNHAGDQFSASRSPEQLKGAIDTTQRLLGGQLEGKMRQAAAAGISEEKFKGLIGDRPFELLKGAEKGVPPAASLPDAARSQLKEGQVTTFGNGQKWKLQNGQPVQVP